MCRLCSGTGREVSPTHCPFLSAQTPMQMGSSLQWQLVVVAPVALSLSLSFLFSSGYHWLAHKHSVRRCCCSVAAAASLAASKAQARQHQHTHSHIQQQQLRVLCSSWNISPYCVYSAANHISTANTIIIDFCSSSHLTNNHNNAGANSPHSDGPAERARFHESASAGDPLQCEVQV